MMGKTEEPLKAYKNTKAQMPLTNQTAHTYTRTHARRQATSRETKARATTPDETEKQYKRGYSCTAPSCTRPPDEADSTAEGGARRTDVRDDARNRHSGACTPCQTRSWAGVGGGGGGRTACEKDL